MSRADAIKLLILLSIGLIMIVGTLCLLSGQDKMMRQGIRSYVETRYR